MSDFERLKEAEKELLEAAVHFEKHSHSHETWDDLHAEIMLKGAANAYGRAVRAVMGKQEK